MPPSRGITAVAAKTVFVLMISGHKRFLAQNLLKDKFATWFADRHETENIPTTTSCSFSFSQQIVELSHFLLVPSSK